MTKDQMLHKIKDFILEGPEDHERPPRPREAAIVVGANQTAEEFCREHRDLLQHGGYDCLYGSTGFSHYNAQQENYANVYAVPISSAANLLAKRHDAIFVFGKIPPDDPAHQHISQACPDGDIFYEYLDETLVEFTPNGVSVAPKMCPDCKGTGIYTGLFSTETCQTCGGTGRA